jgi:Na+/pantothenate symporter
VFLKILIQANSDYRISKYLQTLDRIALWLFAIPIVWIAFAFVCSRINRPPSGQQDHAKVGILSIIVRRKSSDAGIVLNSLSITFLFRIGFNGSTTVSAI